MNDKNSPYKTFGHRRSLRLSNFDYHRPNVYHLIWGTHKHRPLLSSLSLTERLTKLLLDTATEQQMMVYAYCFMPDHVHLLLAPTEGGHDPISFIQRYKSKSTRTYWETGGKGKLWQRGFYDHVLRKDEDIKKITRYILENPVRKGLVDDYRTYQFSGSLIFRQEDL